MAAFGPPDVVTEARHALLALARGDLGAARRRFDAAIVHAETRRVESPETLAWCHVQAGQLAFSTGDWDTAERHYRAALDAAPGDWGAEDHVAELRAAERRFDESIAMYEALVARVRRPELLQALGDVYALAGRKDEAMKRHREALAAYRKAADAGSAHYYHHLAAYLCDVEPAPAEAVTWARKDIEVRTSSRAWDGLAWALHLAGDSAGAVEAMEKALAQGTRDAHVLYHASLVFHRAGNADRAREMLRRASEENPRFNEFHVHR
jgi:tetratricopeptide (TPR) repeat protein